MLSEVDFDQSWRWIMADSSNLKNWGSCSCWRWQYPGRTGRRRTRWIRGRGAGEPMAEREMEELVWPPWKLEVPVSLQATREAGSGRAAQQGSHEEDVGGRREGKEMNVDQEGLGLNKSQRGLPSEGACWVCWKDPQTPNDPPGYITCEASKGAFTLEELFHLCPTPLCCPQSPAGPHSHYLHPTVLQHGVCCNPTKNGRESTAKTLRTAWNQWFAFNRAVHEIRFLRRHREMQETCKAFLANCTSCPRSAHCARDRAREWPSALRWSRQANRAREVHRIEARELSTRASQIICTMWVKHIWAQDTFPCVSALENIRLEVCV